MFRSSRLGLALVIGLVVAAGDARAQWFYPGGYGGYGWGGWGSTFQGDVARGLGAYAVGAGIYNQETAAAESINTDTVIRWNQWMFQSQQEANQREYARIAARQKRDSMTGKLLYERFRDNPTQGDIDHGDALNVILDQLSDPRIQRSALRLVNAKLSGDLIDDIPFVHASDAVVLSLHRLTGKHGWPFALRDDDFAEERKGYETAINKALDEDLKGDLSPKTVREVREATQRLWDKLQASPPEDRMQYVEAQNYIKGLMGMSRMLDKPNVDKIVGELEKVKSTTAGHLIAFMQAFNLRFGVANDDDERAAYRELYAMLAPARDKIMKEVDGGGASTSSNPSIRPTDFFRGMHLDHVKGNGEPAPPKPNP